MKIAQRKWIVPGVWPGYGSRNRDGLANGNRWKHAVQRGPLGHRLLATGSGPVDTETGWPQFAKSLDESFKWIRVASLTGSVS